MKVAVVCDYLNVYGGAERTLEAILEIYPEADVFTSLYDSSKFSPESPIRKANIKSIIPAYFLILTSYFLKQMTFIMPYFFERLDLSAYGLVISVGTIWAKCVKTNYSNQKHIYYCLTPPRFLYGYPSETSKRNVWYYRPFTTILDHWLRVWDYNVAQKPDEIISISQEVQRRVKKFYRRDSVVVCPPVSLKVSDPFRGSDPIKRGYFLIVSRLAAYKGIDVAIRVCNELKLPLKVVGTGREEGKLKSMAGSTIEFLGFRSDTEIDGLYTGAKALIFPTSDEDFGIVPLEANAHGVPVIAHRSGGPLETLVEGKTAVYFKGTDELKEVLGNFDESKFNPVDCTQNASRFDREIFKEKFSKEVLNSLEKSTGTLSG